MRTRCSNAEASLGMGHGCRAYFAFQPCHRPLTLNSNRLCRQSQYLPAEPLFYATCSQVLREKALGHGEGIPSLLGDLLVLIIATVCPAVRLHNDQSHLSLASACCMA